ncbi:hypothetical protein [Pinirhizobacter sp.]|jgi:hypothetical protein|uniref:hypothetical protein n=1 Tax=Pinirhizobacter sp. TaxID=2950432 RepID=UPI002F418C08
MAESEDQSKGSTGASRGPSFPYIDLEEAVGRVRKFFKSEGRAPVPVSSAVKTWGYSEKSSGGRQTVATLVHYGLLKDEGLGESRRVSVSQLALDILLHDEQSKDWIAALRKAALTPKLFDELATKYAAVGLPSDHTLRHYLVSQRDLSSGAADSVVKNLRASLAFARIESSGKIETEVGVKTPSAEELVERNPEVGDLIQWESGGVLQFDTARRVRAVQVLDEERWVFVEGSTTGIPMTETLVEVRAKKSGAAPEMPLVAEPPVVAGERELLRGPLSKDTGYRLLVQGELGSKELGKLIRLLEAQRMVLDDE